MKKRSRKLMYVILTFIVVIGMTLTLTGPLYADKEKPVTGITVTGADTVVNGGSITLSATVDPKNATNASVTWSVATLSVGTANIDATTGVLSATGVGTVTVTATANDGSGVKGDKVVTITPANMPPAGIAVTGVVISPKPLHLYIGETAQLTADVSPGNATNKSVNWSAANSSIASVDNNGLVTAAAAGSTTLTVTTVDGGKTDTCQVQVEILSSWHYVYHPFNCSDSSLSEFRMESGLGNGTFTSPDGKLIITLSNYDGKTFDWSSNIPLYCLIVKLGNPFAMGFDLGTNGVTSGSFSGGLNQGGQPSGISHISFCYKPVIPTPKGKITVTKTIGTGIGGNIQFEFSVTKDGTQFATFDLKGGESEELKDLAAGTYVVTETTSGYVTTYSIDSSLYTAGTSASVVITGTVVGQENSRTVVFDNEEIVLRVGSLTVIKRDITDEAVLSGAEFGLFEDAAGTKKAKDALNEEVKSKTSDADGKVIFTNLSEGTYWVKELTAPAGYGLSGALQVTLGLASSESDRLSVLAAVNDTTPVVNPLDVTIDYRDPRLDGFLRIRKTDSVTGLPVQGATYVVLSGSPAGPVLYRAVTGPDGYITMTGFVWNTPYYIREEAAPAGYNLDPNTYGPAIFGPTALSYNFAVSDDPTGGGGGGTLTVAGITEGGIQVLAFTGIDPIIPISGGAAIFAGLAMLIATLIRKNSKIWKHEKIKD